MIKDNVSIGGSDDNVTESERSNTNNTNTTSNTTNNTTTTMHGTKKLLTSVRNLLDVSSKVMVKFVYKIFPWNRRARRRVLGDGEEDEL